MQLRPYQEQAVNSVISEWKQGRKNVLLVMATGTGKTICFSSVIKKVTDGGKKVLVLAHRNELIEQAQEKLFRSAGIESYLEKGNSTIIGKGLFVDIKTVVGSVQSMSGKRLQKFSPDEFDFIVVDEAHHCVSKSYQKIFNHFPNAKVLGVTATPYRADKKNLAKFFESTAFEYSLLNAIKDKFLCDIEVQRIPLELDIRNVTINAGDYSAGEVANAIDPYLEEIGNKMLDYCKDRKTVIFTPLIKTSMKLKEILEKKDFAVAEVNGNSDDREVILKDFEKNRYNVILNSMLLTEGWDCPSVDCIIILRPTRSFGLYMQMVGRGTRLYVGKKNLLLLDFMWLSKKYDIMNPVKMIAPDDEIENRMNNFAFNGKRQNLLSCMKKAESQYNDELEKAMIMQLEKNRKKNIESISSVEFLASIGELGNLYKPFIYSWEEEPPTQKQLVFIKNQGLEIENIKTKGFAKKIIEILLNRIREGKASIKQIKCLKKHHFKKVENWSFIDASNMIALIQENKWKVPDYINPYTYEPKRK